MRMHRLGQILQTGDLCVLINAQLPGCMLSILANVGMTGDNQSHATDSQLRHKIDHGGGASPLIRGHPHPRRRPDETV